MLHSYACQPRHAALAGVFCVGVHAVFCAGVPLAKEYKEENVGLVTAGCCNLARHIENSRMFGVPVVVAINQFTTDTQAELNAVKQAALDAGMPPWTRTKA